MSRRTDATRRRIIASARELTADRGLDVSMTEVAEHAGVTRMTLYRHFGPRRELLLELLAEDIGGIAERCGHILGDRSVSIEERALRGMVEATAGFRAAPLIAGVLGGSSYGDLTSLDPGKKLQAVLDATVAPFLAEAEAAGLLRGTPERAIEWLARQLVACLYFPPGTHVDRHAISDEVATYFVPSLLRIDESALDGPLAALRSEPIPAP